MATNTDDGPDVEEDARPMFSVATSPPSGSNANANTNQVVVHNNNNNLATTTTTNNATTPSSATNIFAARNRSGSLSSPGSRGSLQKTTPPSFTRGSPLKQSPSTPSRGPTPCPFGTSPGSPFEGPVVFEPPELTEETLLPAVHNETANKLAYILSLVDCVTDVAKIRAAPISYLTICNNNYHDGCDNNGKTTSGNVTNGNATTNGDTVNNAINNNQNETLKSNSTTTTANANFPSHQLCALSGT